MQIDQIFMQIKIYQIMGLFFPQQLNIRFINLHFIKISLQVKEYMKL